MTAKHLLLGLDGADPTVIARMGPSLLPNLHAIAARGVSAPLESVLPFATLPNWSTLLTGADPGEHGVFDFTTRRGYEVAFTGGTVRKVPTIFSRLDALGKSTACIGFPATWPPEKLAHGVFISGWDSPVAFDANASFVWPPKLHAEMRERFGETRFDDVDEFDAESPTWHSKLPEALCARIQNKVALAKWLLDKREWDAFALYFGESDTAAHYLWSLHDECSPRRPGYVSRSDSMALRTVYQALDSAVGELVAHAGGLGVELTIVSDHGAGGSSDKALHLNRALAEARLLTFKKEAAGFTQVLKELALTRLSPRLRQAVFRLAGSVLPGWLESRSRFGAIDMSKTFAFSEELNYFPSVHLNMKGREPQGVVDDESRAHVIARVREALLELRDPWTDQPVVRHVHRREDIYSGAHVGAAPDLILELHLDGEYSYNVMPTRGSKGVWRRLAPSEWLGRKGRSLPGSHRSHGIFYAAGPRVRAAAETHPRMADVTVTFLMRMGIAPSPGMCGRVLDELLVSESPRDALPELSTRDSGIHASKDDVARVESRLRALGYVE